MGIVLRVISGPHSGQELSVEQRDTFTVGRASRVHFPMVYDQALLREHFQIKNEPPLCHLVDLGSTNGTKVNGLRVGRVALREKDVITAGDSAFLVQFVEDSEEALKFATCAGCGGRIPILSTLSLEIEVLSPPDKVNVWLCDECQARRLRFPKTHPDYLIEEWIGEGGMGEVFRATTLAWAACGHQDDQREQCDRLEGQRLFSSGNRGLAQPAHAQRRMPSQHCRIL